MASKREGGKRGGDGKRNLLSCQSGGNALRYRKTGNRQSRNRGLLAAGQLAGRYNCAALLCSG